MNPPGFAWTVRLRQPMAGEDECQAKLVQAKPGFSGLPPAELDASASGSRMSTKPSYLACGQRKE